MPRLCSVVGILPQWPRCAPLRFLVLDSVHCGKTMTDIWNFVGELREVESNKSSRVFKSSVESHVHPIVTQLVSINCTCHVSDVRLDDFLSRGEEDVSPEFREAFSSFLELSLFHLGSKSLIARVPLWPESFKHVVLAAWWQFRVRPEKSITSSLWNLLKFLSFWALQAGWKWRGRISQVAASPTHQHPCVLLSSPPTVLWKGDLADCNSCKQIYQSLPVTISTASFISLHSLVYNSDLWIKQWSAKSAGYSVLPCPCVLPPSTEPRRWKTQFCEHPRHSYCSPVVLPGEGSSSRMISPETLKTKTINYLPQESTSDSNKVGNVNNEHLRKSKQWKTFKHVACSAIAEAQKGKKKEKKKSWINKKRASHQRRQGWRSASDALPVEYKAEWRMEQNCVLHERFSGFKELGRQTVLNISDLNIYFSLHKKSYTKSILSSWLKKKTTITFHYIFSLDFHGKL